ncbi:MAG: transposase [Candidatus Izimaplasma sp.]|nr:transposase [Candidatus Izimaplasma bacterium]
MLDKTKDEGKTLVKIHKYYPSSKKCSICDEYHDIPLSQRVYSCACGNKMDRGP